MTTIRIIMLGDTHICGSSIIDNYIKSDKSIVTIPKSSQSLDNVEVLNTKFEFRHKIHSDEVIIKLMVWNTFGDDNFRSLAKKYYKYADGVIIVYDVANVESFAKIDIWVNEIKSSRTNRPHYLALIGNKTNNHMRTITTDEGVKKAKDLKMDTFIESSAEQSNIDDMFNVVADRIINMENLVSNIKDQVSKQKDIDRQAVIMSCNQCCSIL